MDDVKKDTRTNFLEDEEDMKLSPRCATKTLGEPRGRSGKKYGERVHYTTSQEAEYGTIFGETDRNMEKNMEAKWKTRS